MPELDPFVSGAPLPPNGGEEFPSQLPQLAGTEYAMPFGTELFTTLPANTKLGPMVCAQALGTSADDSATGDPTTT